VLRCPRCEALSRNQSLLWKVKTRYATGRFVPFSPSCNLYLPRSTGVLTIARVCVNCKTKTVEN